LDSFEEDLRAVARSILVLLLLDWFCGTDGSKLLLKVHVGLQGADLKIYDVEQEAGEDER
jgi:hypothetical protein